MQIRNWMLATTVAAALVSCGEAGTNTEKSDSTGGYRKDTSTTNMNMNDTTGTSSRRVEVPEATRSAFAAKYPQAANVIWSYHEPSIVAPIEWEWTGWPKIGSNDYVATFTMDNRNHWIWYDKDGKWISTVEELNDFNTLPAPISHTIKSQFPGYTIKTVDKENDKKRTAYEIKMEKGEDNMKVLISENGHILKKSGNESGEKTKEKNNPKNNPKDSIK